MKEQNITARSVISEPATVMAQQSAAAHGSHPPAQCACIHLSDML